MVEKITKNFLLENGFKIIVDKDFTLLEKKLKQDGVYFIFNMNGDIWFEYRNSSNGNTNDVEDIQSVGVGNVSTKEEILSILKILA